MKHYFYILGVLLLTTPLCHAAFTATGGINGIPFEITPTAVTGLDKVFVFNGMQNSKLTFSDNNPSDWTWYSYVQDPNVAEAVSISQVEVTATNTSVINVQPDHGYFVLSSSGTANYVCIVSWIPVGYSAIHFLNEGDPCQNVTMKVEVTGEPMFYFTASGLKRTLDRQHTVTWNTQDWHAETGLYVEKAMTASFSNTANNWSVTAPFTNTRFTVTGDQFSQWFGEEETIQSSLYSALAVKTSAEAVVKVRTAENESGKSSGELSGSAPLEVQFYSHPSVAVRMTEWYVYKPGELANGTYIRFTDEDLNYTFKESGTYTVKLFVSNSSCTDSAEFSPKISESMLDCPNFFTPRSSPGENDEFRVAYRSIVKFKGVIVNRWGNVLFEWTDPALGWDGNYKGKSVNPGVYFYVIDAVGSDGIAYKKRGDINLLE